MKTDDARKVLEEASRCWDERGSANRPQSGHYITVILQLATHLRAALEDVERVDWLETSKDEWTPPSCDPSGIWFLYEHTENTDAAEGDTIRDAIDAARAKRDLTT